MINQQDYVEIGLHCADICNALVRGVGGKRPDDLGQSVCEAINQLTTCVRQVMRGLDNPLTTKSVAELWRKFKARSPKNVGGT